ncbi:MAG TPA: thiamine-phosphate kinase [bacterium]|nr:thiamine-phosphate kinase [bacterium]
MAELGEFELIARLAARLAPPRQDGSVGIGDDCAAIPHAGGVQLLTCDIAVAGRHFLPGRTPMADVGWKIASANVSDVCACGGRPTHALVSLGVPAHQDPAALDALYDGLAEAAEAYGFAVVGGNVSGADALLVDLFVLGEAPRFIPRGGARPGDRIAVSGRLGGAAAGLALFGAGAAPLTHPLVRRHLRPRARTDLVPLLQRVANAAIDISDGLASELGHVAERSGVCLAIEGARVPQHEALGPYAREQGREALEFALHSGEEYELLFTLPPEHEAALAGQDVTVIGEVRAGSGVLLDGRPLAPGGGWDHLRHP